MFRQGQIEDMRNVMLLEDTPATDESLSYCRSMRDRRRQKTPTQLPTSALLKLKSWVSDESSSLLLAQGQGVRTSCLDFAIDFLDAIIERNHPVLWALPAVIEEEHVQPSLTGIIRSLVSQALSLNSICMEEGVNPVTIKHVKSAKTIDQWFILLERVLSSFPCLFLIIDIGLIETAIENEQEEHNSFTVADFVERMSEIVNRRGRKAALKVAIVAWKFRTITSLDVSEVFDEMHISTDMGRKAERLLRQPKYRAIFRQRNQKFAERFRSVINTASSPGSI